MNAVGPVLVGPPAPGQLPFPLSPEQIAIKYKMIQVFITHHGQREETNAIERALAEGLPQDYIDYIINTLAPLVRQHAANQCQNIDRNEGDDANTDTDDLDERKDACAADIEFTKEILATGRGFCEHYTVDDPNTVVYVPLYGLFATPPQIETGRG